MVSRLAVQKAAPETWLRKQQLIVNQMPTVAGLLLFAEEPQAILAKRCGIKVYRYETQDEAGSRDVLTFLPITIEGCLYDQIAQAVSTTVSEIEKIQHLGAKGFEAIKYPRETLQEIITNAVIHRDYSIADDVHVRIFDNRIEVQSPGRLPAHITPTNILDERFARNGRIIVRLLNKFPNPPNQDVGEGLNTAFEKMRDLGLRDPIIEERDNAVLIRILHEPLASPEKRIMQHLETHETIRNKKAREITFTKDADHMKRILQKMAEKGLIEKVPNTRGGDSRTRRNKNRNRLRWRAKRRKILQMHRNASCGASVRKVTMGCSVDAETIHILPRCTSTCKIFLGTPVPIWVMQVAVPSDQGV